MHASDAESDPVLQHQVKHISVEVMKVAGRWKAVATVPRLLYFLLRKKRLLLAPGENCGTTARAPVGPQPRKSFIMFSVSCAILIACLRPAPQKRATRLKASAPEVSQHVWRESRDFSLLVCAALFRAIRLKASAMEVPQHA